MPKKQKRRGSRATMPQGRCNRVPGRCTDLGLVVRVLVTGGVVGFVVAPHDADMLVYVGLDFLRGVQSTDSP